MWTEEKYDKKLFCNFVDAYILFSLEHFIVIFNYYELKYEQWSWVYF